MVHECLVSCRCIAVALLNNMADHISVRCCHSHSVNMGWVDTNLFVCILPIHHWMVMVACCPSQYPLRIWQGRGHLVSVFIMCSQIEDRSKQHGFTRLSGFYNQKHGYGIWGISDLPTPSTQVSVSLFYPLWAWGLRATWGAPLINLVFTD